MAPLKLGFFAGKAKVLLTRTAFLFEDIFSFETEKQKM